MVRVWVSSEHRQALLRAFSGQAMSMQGMIEVAIAELTKKA